MGCFNLKCINNKLSRPIKKTLDYNILAPWVECWIEDNKGVRVAVGNKSSPPLNTAVIKSFQFGLSNGMGCNIEIFDEQGGSFRKFFEKITIGGTDSVKKYKLKFRWGWQVKDCDNKSLGYAPEVCSINPSQALISKTHTLVLKNITVNYTNGGFKFLLEGSDLISELLHKRDNATVGKASAPVRLVPAVTKFLLSHGIEARFCTMDNRCSVNAMRFANDTADPGGEFEGPLCTGHSWQSMGRSPIEASINWVFKSLPKSKLKGIQVFFADNCVSIETADGRFMPEIIGKPTLIFMEAVSMPDCNEIINQRWSLGTYIVNGGSCSPVISFQPNIQLAAAAAMAFNSGGQDGGAGGGPTFENSGPLDCLKIAEFYKTGLDNVVSTDTQNVYWHFDKHKLQALSKLRIHQHANLNWSPISAEMKIQGDPIYNDPVLMRGRYISVVVINPYHIGGENGNFRWEFLAGAECNQVLSNRNWLIMGAMHDIREGSYTTTLKLMLPAPGMNIPINSPLGGDPSAPKINR